MPSAIAYVPLRSPENRYTVAINRSIGGVGGAIAERERSMALVERSTVVVDRSIDHKLLISVGPEGYLLRVK